MAMNLAKHAQKLRFALIGGVNTAIDFAIFLLLSSLGLATFPANLISTSAALGFSFVANKKFTFQFNARTGKRQIVLFFVTTLVGLWLLQPVIIHAVVSLMGTLGSEEVRKLAGKVVATGFTLVWNYLWYSRVVFKKIS